MTGDGVNDAPALKKANIGTVVDDAADAARSASDIVLTEPGLSVIISAVLTSREPFFRGGRITPVKPSPLPDSWKLREIFATGVVFGTYLAVTSVILLWAMKDTDFFSDKFGVRSIRHSEDEMMSALYLQVSIVSQAIIFVTRSCSWFFVERSGLLLISAFFIAQLVATLIAVYADWGFARTKGIGWGWAGVIWLYSVVFFFPLDWFKFAIQSVLNGKAWDNLLENRTAFTSKKDYGKEEREAQWAMAQRTLHGLQPQETTNLFVNENSYRGISEIAEQAKKRAEVARLR